MKNPSTFLVNVLFQFRCEAQNIRWENILKNTLHTKRKTNNTIMSDEEEDPNKKGNALPLWGNTQTMNINNLIITNIQSSAYFKNDLFKLKTFHEVIDEIYYKVSFLYSMYGFSTYSDRSKNLGWSLYSNSKKKQNHITNKSSHKQMSGCSMWLLFLYCVIHSKQQYNMISSFFHSVFSLKPIWSNWFSFRGSSNYLHTSKEKNDVL